MELDFPELTPVYAEGFKRGVSEAIIDLLVKEYREEFLKDPLTFSQLVRGVLE